jgi:iron complex transport system ATP-binding protein
MTTIAPILSCRGLNLTVPGRTLCRDVAFDVRPGECWVIVGRNGTGKTTMLQTLAGLREPAAGTIILAGLALEAYPPRTRARRLAFLPQDTFDAFPATALEIALGGRHPHIPRWHGESAADVTLARAALTAVGMDAAAMRDVQTLSGGERRRVAIAMLLAQDAEVLLLDEPTNHLDIAHEVRTLELLRSLARERSRAVVMVLHDLTLAARYATHAVLLGNGENSEAGPAELMLTAAKLSALFGHELVAVAQPRGTAFLPA